ncbi:MAG: serine hydrolase, partial [Fusobacterium periodonticum]|nr:serine hydrolase [Fusobacterium periodonticum]
MEKYTDWKKEIEKIISEVKGQVSVSFYDLGKNIAFSIDGNKKVLSASMIKLLILAELMRQVSEAELSLSQKITLTDSMRVGGDGILKILASGHQFSLKELAKLMIVVSDNEATNILIDLLTMENISTLGRNLALKETFLQRKMMDSKAKEKGYDNYTSSDDIALLLRLIYEGKLINEEVSEIILDILLQ